MSGDAFPLAPVLLPKLRLPRPRVSMVQREALLTRLDAATEHKLTLVSAPAGYGKTTLLSAWAASIQGYQARPAVAWVALDAGDNDPVRFWRYFIMACQQIYPGIGQAALALLQAPHLPQPERLPGMMVSTLLNDLSQQLQAGVMVLEDYHLITEPQVHADLTRILDLPESGLRFVLLTRGAPPLPLARLHASDNLYELRVPDLRFTLEETRLFLGRSLSRPLAHEFVQHIAQRTEGWSVGVQLATLALRGHEGTSEATQVLATFSGSNRHILEYLMEEILREQPQPLQTFLLQTSPLDRLTASLCDAVTGGNDSASLLDQLERGNLFLQSLAGTQVWYRYHALFAEAMRHEARQRLGEAEVSACLQRASAWYEREHMLPEAIEAAMQAHDFKRMAILIARLVEPLGNYFERQTLWRWLKAIPLEVLNVVPGLGFLYAASLLFTNDRHAPLTQTRVELPLSLAERYWRDEGNVPRLAQIQSFRALVALWQERYAESFRYARESLLHLPEHEAQWRGMSLLNVGMEALWTGQVDEAQSMFSEARALLAACNATAPLLATLAAQADTCRERGQLHQASMYYQQVLTELERASAQVTYPVDDKGGAMLGLARLSYEWKLLQRAEQEAREALSLTEQHGNEGLRARPAAAGACERAGGIRAGSGGHPGPYSSQSPASRITA
ncbi:hypothetical protein KSC_103950 [Ktedonobacter sp. SOSP1-52]|uniref:hypothetical protein n=1 Tax=Ktedonobacter sp. SOSP1-52 TaxID=2778366 RepID=UPI001A27AE10|nr:hypothetical protein [Ktedonobacter sp. SOSP1-52]GHO71503.1 hypothetical protein KSC_103950 [Ktedonobacter sp. SOSP1-52]